MHQEWWNAARPSFWDRTAFPTEQDVLDAVWLFQDLVAAAERAGDWADAERFRLIAEAARCEYWQRSRSLRAVHHPRHRRTSGGAPTRWWSTSGAGRRR